MLYSLARLFRQRVLVILGTAALLMIFYVFVQKLLHLRKAEGLQNDSWGNKQADQLTMETMFQRSRQLAPRYLYQYNKTLVIPPKLYLDNMTRAELEDLYHRYVENIQSTCGNQIHYGTESDGGYYYCEDVGLGPPCMMYSFGSRNDYSFDDKIANVLGCDVHSFDPGDGQKDHQRSERIWFHAIGLGGTTKTLKPDNTTEWEIYSLSDTRKLLKHENRALDILKIDTEGMIWETLGNISKPGLIDDVKLLIVELHINFPERFTPTYRTKEDYIEHLESLKNLYDLGFRIYYFQRWFGCRFHDDEGNIRTGCHDVHFIQTKAKLNLSLFSSI